jgi:hypothetical protein
MDVQNMIADFKKLVSHIEQLNREKPEDIYAFIKEKLCEDVSLYKSS